MKKVKLDWNELVRIVIGGALWVTLVMVMLYRFPYDNLALNEKLGGTFFHVYQYSGVPNADLLHITSALFGAAVLVAAWLSPHMVDVMLKVVARATPWLSLLILGPAGEEVEVND